VAAIIALQYSLGLETARVAVHAANTLFGLEFESY
jgi:hypothetical protein